MNDILIVDDDPGMRDGLKRVLVRYGHNVFVAGDGQEGMDCQRRHAVQVIITDMAMPNKNGLELISEVRPKYPKTKIIAITGGGMKQSGEEVLAKARLAGADCTFQKPISGHILAAAVTSLILEGKDKAARDDTRP